MLAVLLPVFAIHPFVGFVLVACAPLVLHPFVGFVLVACAPLVLACVVAFKGR